MAIAHTTVVYDVHDFQIWPLTSDTGGSPVYGSAVDVPGIAEVSLEPNFVTNELKGDGKIIAKKGRTDKVAISATYGKVSLDVLKVVLGGVVTDTASTQAEWVLSGTNSLPYFKAAFKIADVDLGLGSVVVVLYKAQLTGGTLLGGSSDEFGQPTMDMDGIALDSNDKLVSVSTYSTSVDISTL